MLKWCSPHHKQTKNTNILLRLGHAKICIDRQTVGRIDQPTDRYFTVGKAAHEHTNMWNTDKHIRLYGICPSTKVITKIYMVNFRIYISICITKWVIQVCTADKNIHFVNYDALQTTTEHSDRIGNKVFPNSERNINS